MGSSCKLKIQTPNLTIGHLLGEQLGGVLVGEAVGVDGVQHLQLPGAADAPLERHVRVAQQVGAVHDQVLGPVCASQERTQGLGKLRT